MTASSAMRRKFQSTHPRRVWQRIENLYPPIFRFNPHTHEGCDGLPRLSPSPCDSFNPHTHEGCDTGCYTLCTNYLVSIHTPTKGVTNYLHTSVMVIEVSIHTPTKGVTWWGWIEGPRHRVSIHTPTKGVTAHTEYFLILREVSIHTPTKGVTQTAISKNMVNKFQSTHPRRVWPTYAH